MTNDEGAPRRGAGKRENENKRIRIREEISSAAPLQLLGSGQIERRVRSTKNEREYVVANDKGDERQRLPLGSAASRGCFESLTRHAEDETAPREGRRRFLELLGGEGFGVGNQERDRKATEGEREEQGRFEGREQKRQGSYSRKN